MLYLIEGKKYTKTPASIITQLWIDLIITFVKVRWIE
jgi:hypothetical protein